MLLDSFQTISECQYFTNIKNKEEIKVGGVSKDNHIIMNATNKKEHILHTNYYPLNNDFKKEQPNCKQIIGWIFDYCRFKL